MAPALRALVAAGVIAVAGAVSGDLRVVGVAYLGAACAVSFATHGAYRNRALALCAQAAGAIVGIAVGSMSATNTVTVLVIGVAAGVISGVVGVIGPNAPPFGVMMCIGVAFGQFGGSTLSVWQQCLCYLLGTAVAAAVVIVPWPFRRNDQQRQAAAEVMFAAADVCAAAGTAHGRAARVRLAAASAAVRSAGGSRSAELTAFAAATLYAGHRRVPAEIVEAIRSAGRQVRVGEPLTASFEPGGDAGLQALADALSTAPQRPGAPGRRRAMATLRMMTARPALTNGARMGLCFGVATATAVALGHPDHAFWLPLTVAVIVRPEYGSVFVRTVNRVAGTFVGAMLSAALLWIQPFGIVTALAAAVSLSVAVLMAPKSYGLYVIGVTASTLLAASMGRPDPVLLDTRLIDTAIGAVIAVVFGYLLWPGSRRLPGAARLEHGITAAEAYLTEAVKPPADRRHWQVVRDDAYRAAHEIRSAGQAALCEPPPVNQLALEILPAAADLEDVVDAVTAIGAAGDAGQDAIDQRAAVRAKLDGLATRVDG